MGDAGGVRGVRVVDLVYVLMAASKSDDLDMVIYPR
jgi:hypothetical protein